MLLFCGIPTETPLSLAIEAAERAQAPFVVLNQRHASFCDMSIEGKSGGVTGRLALADTEYDLASFEGIYARLMDPADLPECRPDRRVGLCPVTAERAALLYEMLTQWLEVTPARVLNRASRMASNASKPYQAQLIRRSGFLVPPTLVTNDPRAALEFRAKHRRVIFKSLSSVRSIVKELDDSRTQALWKLHHLPTQFQAFIDGLNIRVHVVGREVFATGIESDAVDYRYAHRDGHRLTMSPTKLPKAITSRCRQLSEQLQLPLCGIDLKRTPDGAYYCFEVNPSPAYSFYEEQTEQPISRAIVRYLRGEQL